MQTRMTETAAGEGLEFRFDIARGGNTFDAHRIVHLAAAHGAQDAMKERIMRAYLSEGELISDHATLERLAVEVGLPGRRGARGAEPPIASPPRSATTSAPPPGSGSAPCRSSSSTARSARRARTRPSSSSSCCARPAPPTRRPRVAAAAASGETCAVDGSGC